VNSAIGKYGFNFGYGRSGYSLAAPTLRMNAPNTISAAKTAILTLAEIKAATDAFDRGDINVFDALDEIRMAVEAYRAAASPIMKVA
jgi:hypothetical protein